MRLFDTYKGFEIWLNIEFGNVAQVYVDTFNKETDIRLTRRSSQYSDNLPNFFAEEKTKIDDFTTSPEKFLDIPEFRKLNRQYITKINQAKVQEPEFIQ